MFVILVTEEYDHARQWKPLTGQPPHIEVDDALAIAEQVDV
jgi:hypothetical protein